MDRHATQFVRTDRVVLGELVGQHDGRPADLDFGVVHRSVRHGDAINLGGAKGPLVKLDSVVGILAAKIGRGALIADRNGIHFGGHAFQLLHIRSRVQLEFRLTAGG